MHLEGKVALVLGAVKGIGRGIGLALARDGVRVAYNYWDWPEAPFNSDGPGGGQPASPRPAGPAPPGSRLGQGTIDPGSQDSLKRDGRSLGLGIARQRGGMRG